MSLDARLSPQIDLQHPWLGLESFSESTRCYFFGRDAEAAELLKRLRLHPLLVLYGRSGLGKTSLLRARLVPDLEKLGARPAFYRISYRKGEDSPLEQLAVALEAWGSIDLPGFVLPNDPASRLWLNIHYRERKDAITHLILDQFEEIFTLGAEWPGADPEVRQALAIFVQGGIPPPVEALLDEGEAFLKHFQLDVPPLPVLLSVRQDYVFALNRWRSHLHQLGENHYELRALRGPAAFDAVFKPGELRCHYRGEVSEETKADTGLPPIVSEESARRIVHFVAKEKENVPLEEIEAVPPILSLLCRELNERRFTGHAGTSEQRAAQITFHEGETDIETIIATFYERCLAGRPEGVRIFIEEELVSRYSGARLQQDERSILKVFADGCEIPGAADGRRAAGYGDHGAARACLEDLVNQRLLTAIGGGNNPGYELIHDLLAAVVEKSRTAREERFEKAQADRRAEAERKAKEDAEASVREAAERAAALNSALQRETQARRDADFATRRARWLAVAAILVALIAIAGFIAALAARAETERQKKEADTQRAAAEEATKTAQQSEERAVAAAKRALNAEQIANEEKAKALALLMQASEQDYYAALRLIKDGDSNLALSYLARSIQYDPKNELARMALGQVLLFNQNIPFKLAAAPLRHEMGVLSAAFSPDGRFVVTASEDNTARVWEAASGKPIGEPLRHEKAVRSTAFSPDGRFVVTASEDNTAWVWEAASGKPIGEPLRHEKAVSSAAFSPDGRFVVTASEDNTARVWEAASGKPIGEPLRHEKAVSSAAFSPDGRFVVTASSDNTARVWEAASGKPIGEPLRHEKAVSSAAFSPDGRFVVTASEDNTARVWEAATGKPIGKPLRHEKAVSSAAFSPDGRFVVTASEDGTARVWEAASGKPIGEPLRHATVGNVFEMIAGIFRSMPSFGTARVREAKIVSSAAFSPDGRFVVTASSDNTARVWEAATGKPIGEPLRHEKAVSSAAFSPDGRFVVTASSDGKVRIWEAATGKPIGEPLRHENIVSSAAFSPDGRFVVTASWDKTARVWEAATGKPIGEPLRHENIVSSAAFSPDGRFVVTASWDNTAHVWEAATGKPIGEPLRHEKTVSSAAFSPDGRFVVTASWDKTARVWEAATGKPIGEPLRHEKAVSSAAFSPDGRFAVTASSDKTARVWEAATGKPIGEPLRHEKAVSSAAFSADGRFVVTASSDNTAHVWEAATGKPIGKPLRHEKAVWSAAFSADGRFVVTASEDNTAHVWEAATGKPIGEPLRHEKAVSSAAFSPDGRFAVTASSDKTARVWEAATGKPIGEPLRHENIVSSAAFSPDGRFVVTASWDNTARVWPWFKPLGDSPEKLVASIEQITFCKIAQDGGPAWIFPETALSDSELSESVAWFAESTRTRTIWLGALQTVPQFIVNEIQDARRFRKDRNRAKSILDNAYPIDPAHPLIHLALAMVEDNEQTAAFLRDYDLKRLPESCGYTKDLDPKEVLKLGAEMCAEQGDEERAQMVRHKLVAAYRSALEVGTKADLPQDWATTQYNLGNALLGLRTRSSGAEEGRELLEDAVAAYRSALEVRTKADLPQDWATTQTALGVTLSTLSNQLKGEEGLKRQRESVELLREVVSYQPGDQSHYWLAYTLGGLAFNLVLNGQFAEAQTRCEEAQRLASEISDGVEKTARDKLIIFIQGNLAHTLLFRGHYDEALAIYRQYWDKPLHGKTFGEVTLDNFAAFDKAGLTHPDLSRMKRALGDLPSKPPSQ